MNLRLCLLASVLFMSTNLWGEQRSLKVYRTVDANGVVGFSDQPRTEATAVVVHTYQPDAVTVEVSADNAALTAEIADQLAEERLERLALLAEAQEARSQRAADTRGYLDVRADDVAGYGNRPGYSWPTLRPPLRPHPHPGVPPVTTEVGEHFKAGWPGRLHPFGPVGANGSAGSSARR